jgi:hypothetical protein
LNIEDLDNAYLKLKQIKSEIIPVVATVFLRMRKFLALPYCYYKFLIIKPKNISKIDVIKDFLYIFFVLKYYPENYGYCRLYEKKRSEWKYYYGSNYDAYQKYKLEKEVQRKEYKILFEDKMICEQLCRSLELSTPRSFGMIDPGEYRINKDFFDKYNVTQDKIMIKPIGGSAGKGILFIEKMEGEFKIRDSRNKLYGDAVRLSDRCLLQEFVELDEELKKIASAVSMRFLTFFTRSNSVLLMACEILTSVDNNYVSNWSAGGIAIAVDIDSGKLFENGYDKFGNKYSVHPTSNIRFSEYKVPQWELLKEFSIKVQKSFPYYRLLGPDISLTVDGPILYEINAIPDLASSEQTCGPLLKNPAIYKEFKNYNLLINRF